MSITLDIAIPTWKPDGPERFIRACPPQVEGVRYVLSWQEHEKAPLPEALVERNDVAVFRTEKKGLSANRNNALDHCRADIVLNGDDDMRYSAEGLHALMRTFESHPDVDLIMVKIKNSGNQTKVYPEHPCSITARMPRGLWAGTPELAVRRAGRVGALRFDPAYGPGAALASCGEDEMYLLAARRSGCLCMFYPVVVAEYDGDSAGQRAITDMGVAAGMGGVIRHSYPALEVLPRLVLKAWRMKKSGQAPFFRSLAYLLKGAALLPPPVR